MSSRTRNNSRLAALIERLYAFTQAHQALAGVACGVLAVASLAAIFWFTLFSGISGSADFIYAQF